MSNKSTAVVLSDEEFAADFDVSLLKQPAKQEGLSAEAQAIVDGTATKSDKIRQLLGLGMKRGDVAKALNVRYQHVRNVEITPIKRK